MENGKEHATIMFLWDYVDNYDDDNCFCRMVERRKELNLLSSRDHSPHCNSSDLHRTWVHILLNPLSQCCPHIEISQMIYSVNQLTSFYMRATLALNRLIKNYCITISIQKFSSIHKFILKMQQILGSHELKALTIFEHAHLKNIASTFSFPGFVPACKKSVYSICSFLRYNQF